jgi:UDP-N-acetylmuramyl pentapeptide synthase
LYIFVKAVAVALFPFLPYPEVLIVEMGVDKPGDMKYLIKLAPVDIGIVTAITETPAHTEHFKDVEQLAKEKLQIYKSTDKISLAILNSDEPRAVAARESLKGLSLTVGIDQPADLTAAEIDFAFDPAVVAAAGLRFKFHYEGSVVPVFIPGVIGRPTVYSALFAALVGLQYDLNLVAISAALKQYQAPCGRLRVLAGVNQATIIDDTYNASPAAVRAAMSTLQSLTTSGRKFVCLGEMAELGKTSKTAHRTIGKVVAHTGLDGLFVVGELGAELAAGAVQAGFPGEAVHHFPDSVAAGTALAAALQANDIVLVKGSQVARMEKTVKACLADSTQADQLLVRQYGNWRTV